MVRATFTGTGTKKILLIAHMDTVYPRGMLARQPFRIDGDRAYGLGIADDKQGIAVIIHTLAILKAIEFPAVRHAHGADQRRRGGQLAGFAQPDQQARRRARRNLSVESSRAESDKLSLATSRYRLRHAEGGGQGVACGLAPEKGRQRALRALRTRCLQTRDLSDPAVGLKMNWTLATRGHARAT